MSDLLINRLIELENNPSLVSERNTAFARLRRGLSHPGLRYDTFRYVEPFVPEGCSETERLCRYLVAGLFAFHPLHTDQAWSLGRSFTELRHRRKSGAASLERRFSALLDAHLDDAPNHLRHAFALLKAESVPVNYHRLLTDLTHWSREDRRVQLRWARDYWRDANAQAQGQAAATTSTETEA